MRLAGGVGFPEGVVFAADEPDVAGEVERCGDEFGGGAG